MYGMIRCSEGFEVVILISPADAKPDTPDAKYYIFDGWLDSADDQRTGPKEIGANDVIHYFSGLADWLGFEIPPEETFPTLEATARFIFERQSEWAKKRLAEKSNK